MAGSQFLRYNSIKTTLLISAKHNKRTLNSPKENINQSRSYLNYSLAGADTAEGVNKEANLKMIDAGIDIRKLRKNQVLAVEIIFSLPIDRHSQDTSHFFIDCLEWVKLNFAGELLSFDVHLDEASPHAHALILPIIDGKMSGDKVKGDRTKVTARQNSFFAEVGINHGLIKLKKLSVNASQSLMRQVIERLEDTNDPVIKSPVWDIVRDDIAANPIKYADKFAIDIQLANRSRIKEKSFVDHKRSKGRGSFIT